MLLVEFHVITNDATLGPRTLCLILWLVGFMSNFRVKNDVLSAYKIFHFEIKSYLQDLYFYMLDPTPVAKSWIRLCRPK